MELTPYVEALRHDLLNAAAAGTEQTRETARLLAAALDPSTRLCLVDALSALAAEVTTAWDGGSVEIRMHGREPQVVVTGAESLAAPPVPPPPRDCRSTRGWFARSPRRCSPGGGPPRSSTSDAE